MSNKEFVKKVKGALDAQGIYYENFHDWHEPLRGRVVSFDAKASDQRVLGILQSMVTPRFCVKHALDLNMYSACEGF